MKVNPNSTKVKDSAEGSVRPRRITLPVAPLTNARIRFATITGQAMKAMSPEDAVALVAQFSCEGSKVEAVDIDGPGDPLATSEATIECLNMLHQSYPELDLGIVTNGLGLSLVVELLRLSGLRRVTLKVDAITTEAANKIYAWIRPGTRTMPLAQGVVTLLREQAAAVSACAKAQIAVTIATTVYSGFNDGEVEDIALKMAELGAAAMSIIPYRPMPNDMGCLEAPSPELMAQVNSRAAMHLPVTKFQAGEGHIVGTDEGITTVTPSVFSLPKPSSDRPNVAVTSLSGMDIDQHLGQASRLLIYGPRKDGLVCLLETRATPAAGGGSERWQTLAGIVTDCFALLTEGAGESPRAILSRHGLTVLITDEGIEGVVDTLYGGGKKNKKGRG